MIEICGITEENLSPVAESERLLFSDPWTENALKGHLATQGGTGYLLLFKGEMAGYLIGSLTLGEGELFRIGILPVFRRKGLGKALISHFLKEAKKAGAKKIFLEVRESNLPARTLYEALGFHIIGERKRYYRDPVEGALLYQKDLS